MRAHTTHHAKDRTKFHMCTARSHQHTITRAKGLLGGMSMVNAFSTTSWHLDARGLVSECSANYTACGWDGDVLSFNSGAVSRSPPVQTVAGIASS